MTDTPRPPLRALTPATLLIAHAPDVRARADQYARLPAAHPGLLASPHTPAPVRAALLEHTDAETLPLAFAGTGDPVLVTAALAHAHRIGAQLPTAGELSGMWAEIDAAAARTATELIRRGGADPHTWLLRALTADALGRHTARVVLAAAALVDKDMIVDEATQTAVAYRADQPVRLSWLAGPAGRHVDDATAAAMLATRRHDLTRYGPDDAEDLTTAVLATRPRLRAATAGPGPGELPAEARVRAAHQRLREAERLAAAVPGGGLRGRRALRRLLDRRDISGMRQWVITVLAARPDLSPAQRRLLTAGHPGSAHASSPHASSPHASTAAALPPDELAGGIVDAATAGIRRWYLSLPDPPAPEAARDLHRVAVFDLRPAEAHPAASRLAGAFTATGAPMSCWQTALTLADTFRGTVDELLAVCAGVAASTSPAVSPAA